MLEDIQNGLDEIGKAWFIRARHLKTLADIRRRVGVLFADYTQFRQQVKNRDELLAKRDADIKQLKATVRSLTEAAAKDATFEAQLDQVVAELIDALGDVEWLRGYVATLEDGNNRLQASLNVATKERDELRILVGTQEGELARIEQALKDANVEVASLRKQLDSKEREFKTLAGNATQWHTDFEQQKLEINEAWARQAEAQNRAENLTIKLGIAESQQESLRKELAAMTREAASQQDWAVELIKKLRQIQDIVAE